MPSAITTLPGATRLSSSQSFRSFRYDSVEWSRKTMSQALDPKLALASCCNEARHGPSKISTISSNPAKATMAFAIAANMGFNSRLTYLWPPALRRAFANMIVEYPTYPSPHYKEASYLDFVTTACRTHGKVTYEYLFLWLVEI
jgi:hypothetical protein